MVIILPIVFAALPEKLMRSGHIAHIEIWKTQKFSRRAQREETAWETRLRWLILKWILNRMYGPDLTGSR
jgi:DNA-binding transcriptional regulator/RsmH inhibitor MraZ